MRILNVSSLYPPHVVGGAELGIHTISEAIARAGHDVHVVTLDPPSRSGTPAAAANGPVTVHRVPLANVYWPFDASRGAQSRFRKMLWHGIDIENAVMARRVRQIVRRIRPDVVLTHNLQGFSTAVMPAIKQTGVTLVHVPHDYALLCPQTALWRNGRACGVLDERCLRCRALTAPRRRHLAAVDAVISVSQSLLDFHRLHGLFSDVPATVIYNALRAPLTVRESVPVGHGDDVMTFGFLGRVERSKGIETLLEAASRLEARGHRFRLRVAGQCDPVYLATLRKHWPLASVEYVGYVDAATYLAETDVLVFPSEWLEALGNGVFEAYSQGVPVIGSAVGGIPESIDEGETGFVVAPGDSVELAARMSCLLADPGKRQEMAASALVKAREYLPSNRAGEYLAFLNSILASRHRNPCQ